jgi:hypothetical protein
MSDKEFNPNSIDAKLSEVLTKLETIQHALDTQLPALETRVATLEHKVWWASGAAAIVGFILPFILKLIT